MIKFCILTTQRSGSVWFKELLDNHSAIRAFGEVFIDPASFSGQPREWNKHQQPDPLFFKYSPRESRPFSTWRFLSTFDTDVRDYEAVGFKLMYAQLFQRPEIILSLVFNRYKIVHLIRRNFLNIILSTETSKKRGLSHSIREVKDEIIRLDPSRLLVRLKRHEKALWLTKMVTRLLPNQTMRVYYEQLSLEPQAVVNKVAEFLLGVESNEPVTSKQKKMSKGSHPERIANYEEIERLLRGTKFYPLLDSP